MFRKAGIRGSRLALYHSLQAGNLGLPKSFLLFDFGQPVEIMGINIEYSGRGPVGIPR